MEETKKKKQNSNESMKRTPLSQIHRKKQTTTDTAQPKVQQDLVGSEDKDLADESSLIWVIFLSHSSVDDLAATNDEERKNEMIPEKIWTSASNLRSQRGSLDVKKQSIQKNELSVKSVMVLAQNTAQNQKNVAPVEDLVMSNNDLRPSSESSSRQSSVLPVMALESS